MKPLSIRWSAATLLLAPACFAFQASTGANLPYAAVHDPEFISAAEATFMHPGDRLIGVMAGDVAKAYPAGILSQHGLVEDHLPAGPIAVTW